MLIPPSVPTEDESSNPHPAGTQQPHPLTSAVLQQEKGLRSKDLKCYLWLSCSSSSTNDNTDECLFLVNKKQTLTCRLDVPVKCPECVKVYRILPKHITLSSATYEKVSTDLLFFLLHMNHRQKISFNICIAILICTPIYEGSQNTCNPQKIFQRGLVL